MDKEHKHETSISYIPWNNSPIHNIPRNAWESNPESFSRRLQRYHSNKRPDKYFFFLRLYKIHYIPGVANLRLISHMLLLERLFVALDKCARVPFSFLYYYFF
jgi:hypothetical protein